MHILRLLIMLSLDPDQQVSLRVRLPARPEYLLYQDCQAGASGSVTSR